MDFTIDYDVGPKKRRRESVTVLEDYQTDTFADSVYTPEFVCAAAGGSGGSVGTTGAAGGGAEEDDDEEEEVPLAEPAEALTATEFYDRFVRRTPEACIAELMAPQRSQAWLDARKHAITASNFGAASGNNKYEGPAELVISKLWSTFQGNEATRYGTFHEPDARASLEAALEGPLRPTLVDQYVKAITGRGRKAVAPEQVDAELQYSLFETGLLKHSAQPWMAVSPDGILRLTTDSDAAAGVPPVWLLVEYKCPARLRDAEDHPYKKDPHNVPPYYMDQMQGILGLFNKFPELQDTGFQAACSSGASSACSSGASSAGGGAASIDGPRSALFVVWQPHQFHVTLVPFQKEYYSKSLEPALEAWYFGRYLPLATLQYNGQLGPGTDTASPPIGL